MPDSKGVVRGKAALRAYWNAALKTMPDLHFEIVGVYQGESVLVIHYRNQSGALVNEVLEFDDGLVRRGHGTYQAAFTTVSMSCGAMPEPMRPFCIGHGGAPSAS